MATNLVSGDIAIEIIRSEWPSILLYYSPVFMSQTIAVLSEDPDIKNYEFYENSTEFIKSEWPSNIFYVFS